MVSVCRSLSDSGVQFTLGWNDTDSNVCVLHEICGMEDLVGVSPGCCAPPEGRMVSAARRCWYRPGRMPCADIWCT